jgi:hypothetical protein
MTPLPQFDDSQVATALHPLQRLRSNPEASAGAPLANIKIAARRDFVKRRNM